MTREMIKQVENDYWKEKADPIDMAEVFDLAIKALEQEPTGKIDCEHTDCNNCVNHKYCDYEPTTKNDLGVDCIDRAKTQTEIEMNAFRYTLAKERGGTGEVVWNSHLISIDDAVDIIRNMPSVTPQEPKTGHWEYGYAFADGNYCKCSECKEIIKCTYPMRYCPNCGARMVEPQESEDKE